MSKPFLLCTRLSWCKRSGRTPGRPAATKCQKSERLMNQIILEGLLAGKISIYER